MRPEPSPAADANADRPSRRWLAHPVLSAVIAVSWLLLQGSVELVHMLWAVILGLGLPWLVTGFLGAGLRPRAPWTALRLLLTVLRDIVVANVAVAQIVLNPRKDPQPAWVRVPYTLQEPLAVTLLATIITNTPGTISCVVDEERREILVHALDAPRPQAIVDEIVERYEQPLKEIFG